MEFVSRLNPLRRSVPNLVVAQRVIDKMTSAAAHFMEDETGEAMVGLLVPGTHTNGVPTLYVLDTIAPDETAVRQFHTFQQGDERQDELIWWLQENWRIYRESRRDKRGLPLASKWDVPLRYLGDWHKQPGFMIQPSTGDLMTARNWIADGENGMDFLLAPIVTLGHPALSSGEQAGTNFVSFSSGDDTNLRADFWYIDRHYRDFLPICPSVYPNEQLPELPDYPWHLVNETRFNAEYDLMEKDGLFTTLVLWDAGHAPPLDICFLTARMGAEKVLLLVTPWNYPAAPPRARLAPYQAFGPDEDLYEVFAALWQASEPVKDPPDWKWSEGRFLIDYIYALEEALDLKATPPAAAQAAGGGGSTETRVTAEAASDSTSEMTQSDAATASDEAQPSEKPEESP